MSFIKFSLPHDKLCLDKPQSLFLFVLQPRELCGVPRLSADMRAEFVKQEGENAHYGCQNSQNRACPRVSNCTLNRVSSSWSNIQFPPSYLCLVLPYRILFESSILCYRTSRRFGGSPFDSRGSHFYRYRSSPSN